MLNRILSKNDLGKHSISKRCQGLRCYLILICETAVDHFRLRLLN
jgi:hypothetical protein